MIPANRLRRIAAWSHGLNDSEIEIARAGIIEKCYSANECVARGDHFQYWAGVVSGLVRVGIVSRGGKATTLTGFTAGAWFGEGALLKNEIRRYDVIALGDTRLAIMDQKTFFWLLKNSSAFSGFLVGQLNERLSQFIALVEYGRSLNATARIARCIASLFNPILYPTMSPQDQGLIQMEYGGITVIRLDKLITYGE
jgi:CRP-like cAMP-binding protein